MKNKMNKSEKIEYRYERKFFVRNQKRQDIEKIVLFHPAFFREIYQERYINNIYFDYLELNNFYDNIIGNTQRHKYRIRWYGDLFSDIEKPKLEIKIKKGLVGTKKIYPLKKFKLFEGMDSMEIKKVVDESEITPNEKISIQSQMPFIINRYKRKYFESFDKKFRITIDNEQSFNKVNTLNNTFLQKIYDLNNVIVELKYEIKHEADVEKITNKLPFRLTKSSKYARGIELLYC